MTELMRKLLDQYNDQNGTVKPAFTEEYDYKMTEAEFDKVFAALKTADALKLVEETIKKQQLTLKSGEKSN